MLFYVFYWLNVIFNAQVVFCIMKVSPAMRLSEEALTRSLVRFYREMKLVPPGVSVEALQPWAAKLCYAAHKLVRRFRKLYAESRHASKSSKLQELKNKCLKAEIPHDQKGSDSWNASSSCNVSRVGR